MCPEHQTDQLSSHPQSPNFGRHWTQDEVIAKFSPSNETLTTVRDWLVKNGISERRITHSDNKAWFAFDATTKEVEDLLHTQYHEFEHSSTGNYVAACDQYHVPKHIQEHIDFISPGVKGANLRKRGSKKAKRGLRGSPARKQAPFMPKNVSSLATCDQVVTPACIQALYKIAPNDPHAKVSPNNSLGIFEEGDFYAQGDLDRFFGNFTPYIPNGTHPIPNLIDGAKAPVSLHLAGGESDLDFQLAYPLIYPQTTTLYQTDDIYYSFGNDPNATGLFNTFFDAIDGSYCTYSAFGETGNDPVLDPKYPNTQQRLQGRPSMRRLQTHKCHLHLLRRARARFACLLPTTPVQRVAQTRSAGRVHLRSFRRYRCRRYQRRRLSKRLSRLQRHRLLPYPPQLMPLAHQRRRHKDLPRPQRL